MSEPSLKFENNALLKPNFTLELFRPFKVVYTWCFSLGEILDFRDLLQKKFSNINYKKIAVFVSTQVYLQQGQFC